MVTEVYDLETLSNLFTYTGYCLQDKKYYQFVIHAKLNQAEELYKHLKRDENMYQVGFNNENFDYPLEHYFLDNFHIFKHMSGQEIAMDLYAKSQSLISSEEFTSIRDKDKHIKQYDLYQIWHYNNKARITSLKNLEFVMQMENIEEMPFHHTTWINTLDEINKVLSYNKNDVDATTRFLFVTLGQTDYSQYKGKNKMELRTALSKKFNIDCHNWPDVKIGEQLMLTLYSRATNQNQWDVNKLRTERSNVALKDCVPPWCNLNSKEFKRFLDIVNNTVVTVPGGKFETSIIFHGIRFDFGLGGSHGCIKSGIYNSDKDYVIYDLDVASLYPSIAKSLKLYPQHLGPEFVNLYSQFIDKRIAEKHKPKDERDMVLIEGYKLILNGVYGKSGEATSFMYDLLYTYKTTIAGQLFIAMWAERMVEKVPDLEFIQINTDGITIKLKRTSIDKIKEVCSQLTKETGLSIEDAYYNKMIIRDVNNYIGVYEDSTIENEHIKLKGTFMDDVEYHQNSSMKIVPIALKNYFVYDIPIEKTIREHKNIFDFCLRLKINSSSKAQWHYLDGHDLKFKELHRTTRYFISNKGGGLVVYYNNSDSPNRINKGFNTTLFNNYYKSDNYDINYKFYESECRKIIYTIEDKQLKLF